MQDPFAFVHMLAFGSPEGPEAHRAQGWRGANLFLLFWCRGRGGRWVKRIYHGVNLFCLDWWRKAVGRTVFGVGKIRLCVALGGRGALGGGTLLAKANLVYNCKGQR